MGFEFSSFRMNNQPRASAPHCDSSILHAPGACKYCDLYPEYQEYRAMARIAFTGSEEELGTDYVAPCPSTRFRSPETRDLWGGNVASKDGTVFGWFKRVI